jgi:hypothetical protein
LGGYCRSARGPFRGDGHRRVVRETAHRRTKSARIRAIATWVVPPTPSFSPYPSPPILLRKKPKSTPQTLASHSQDQVSPTPLPTEIAVFSIPDDPGIVVTAPPPPLPEYTDEPVPTTIPTPVTTPLPVSAPPYIEEIEVQPPDPFWMYWVQGDELWRMTGQGGESQLFVDSFSATGKHLVGLPAEASDCCITGPNFSVSPDQRKVALVILEPALIDPNNKLSPENYATAIHIYDAESGASQAIGRGALPIWAPNNKQLAFMRERSLWVADIETGTALLLVDAVKEKQVHIYAWSPDSTQLAFMYSRENMTIPEIWLLNVTEGSEAKMLLSRESESQVQDIAFLSLKWAPNGEAIYYLSSENGDSASYTFQNLWRVSTSDGTAQPLTTGMQVGNFGFVPEQPWIFLSGIGVYDYAPREPSYYNIWLLNDDDRALRRITVQNEDWYAYAPTPDGAHLLVFSGNRHSYLLSLVDGTLSSMDYIKAGYVYGGAE